MAKETPEKESKVKEANEQVEKPEGASKKTASKAKPEAKTQAAKKEASSSKTASPAKAGAKKGGGTPRARLAEKTFFAKAGQIPQNWRIVDAANIPLGRLSTLIATILMGKDKPTYTRSMDMSDNVIVINCEKVALSGSKWEQKTYNYHTGFAGGIKTFTAQQIKEDHPKRLIEWSVFGMLPKGHMGRRWYKKLWVYAGPEHPHQAQQPVPVVLPNIGLQGRNA